jgi:hypothetical protein
MDMVEKAARLYRIRTQMDAAAEWFADHEPRASEIAARQHVEDIKFLLSLIET